MPAIAVGYARDYISIYSIGTIFIQLTVGLNYFINVQGYTSFTMKFVMTGAILNIVLDSIFIHALGMGVKGAALATVIAQGILCLLVLSFIFGKMSLLHIHKNYLKPDLKILEQIITLGMSHSLCLFQKDYLQFVQCSPR